jgi:glycosyltransferase involved in cell wall biosynthesis
MISVGRLAKEKNWTLLLEAASFALEKHPDLRLVLLGDGPDRQDLEVFAAELGIAGRVDFMGSVPFDEVPAYLKAADFFGFASTTETQGLVTMEALAAGLPVIAVEASGTRDIIQNEQQGLLVDEDTQALANGMNRLLSDEDRFQRFRQAAQARIDVFSMTTLAGHLTDVYEQANQDKKANRVVEVR